MQFQRRYSTEVSPDPALWLRKYIFPYITIPRMIVIVIMVLSLGLQIYNLHPIGDADSYYTAAVKSMLQSWHNFFFVAAEPGGSVSVDKPPLGFWIEAIFGYFFGVSGFSLAMTNVLAGVFEIPVLYHLVKKYMGELAGLMAALVMALTPVFVAAHRHNTIDGMLTLALLLAAWAFTNATETGKIKWVLLGGLFVGIGFNIKMSEALLPVPAFYSLYFLGSKETWLRKAFRLTLTSVVLIVVSLSWVLAVDFTPVTQRPFVGSTTSNREMELIFQQNAMRRLFESRSSQSQQVPQPPPAITTTATTYQEETGIPGTLRFFVAPLSKQLSWVLPFALASLLLLLVGSKVRLPLETAVHKALILWGGWLITCLVLFSMLSGIFHAYYTVVMVPALGAMAGAGLAQIWNLGRERRWVGMVFSLAALVTLAFQWFAVQQYQDRIFLIAIAGVLFILGVLLQLIWKRVGYLAMFLAILLIPAYWTLMTTLSNPDRAFPSAYVGGSQSLTPDYYIGNNPNPIANRKILTYLDVNTQDVKYLVAVPTSLQGSPLVLTSGRPILYIGGFGGHDPVATAADLAALVSRGELRYVLYRDHFRVPGGTSKGDPQILDWLGTSCFVEPKFKDVIIYTRIPLQPSQSGLQEQNGGYFVLASYKLFQVVQGHEYLTLYVCP